MDSLLPALANNGLAGLLVAVIVFLHWYNVRVENPRLIREARTQHREDLTAYREEAAALRAQHDRHVTAIIDRLERIEQHLANGAPWRQQGHPHGQSRREG